MIETMTLTYDLTDPDSASAGRVALDGHKWRSVVVELLADIRKEIKDGRLSIGEITTLEGTREVIWQLIEEHDLHGLEE